MNEYRSTINIAGCRRGETAMFPDTTRTAVLVSQGVLVPVVPSILERAPEPELVQIDQPANGQLGVPITGDGTSDEIT